MRQAIGLAADGQHVEFNLSARSMSSCALLADFATELARMGADPELLVVELTETALLDDEPSALRFMTTVKELGCQLALDDFGTGYGAFTYLKQLPVDYLKIDREFVADLATSAASRHVVRAVVRLAHDFGQRAIAEGVEDEETLEALRDLGVDLVQGYLLDRPKPLEAAFGVAAGA
jgi:EAL domain-containing protein (putative c-di-GMP-specific phosphodiesterase class I)